MRMLWVGLAALAALWILVAMGVWRAGTPRRAGTAEMSPSDEIVAQALRQARGDSSAPAAPAAPVDPGAAEDKSRWMPEVKGFDVSDLAPERRAMFVRFANAQRCTCGCGYTLAGCRTYDPSCPVSGPRVEKLLDSVRAGRYSGHARSRSMPSQGG